jgi:hypothetical protein
MPFGSGQAEFEANYNSRVKPFLTGLYRFPRIPAVLHYSGTLLQWIERYHSEFISLLDELIGRRQVELLGGGFYEPLLPLVPPADRIGQIEMLTTYLRKHFGKRPTGCWLPGLVWEQNLIGALVSAGINYTFLEAEQFGTGGASGPRLTEDQGKTLTVFPLSQRYGEAGADEIIRQLTGPAGEPGGSPGGEPGAVISVFLEKPPGGVEGEDPELSYYRFFEALDRAVDESRLLITTPGRFLKGAPTLKKAFFPSSAGHVFTAWAADTGHLVTRAFLVKYPEANGIYSKMMYTGAIINQLKGDKVRKRTAREELWKAQGWDVLCHLGDGGAYKSSLRNAAYRSLLDAEGITREKGSFVTSVLPLDIDFDGQKEYLFQNKNINFYVRPLGAAIFEFDYLPKTWNYLDTFARRQESYLPPISALDECPRGAFQDRLAPEGLSFGDAAARRFGLSRNCALERYECVNCVSAKGMADFTLGTAEALPFGGITIEKKYRIRRDGLTVNYILSNRGAGTERFCFVPEMDFSFAGEGPASKRVFALIGEERRMLSGESGEFSRASALEFQDIKNEIILNLEADSPLDFWVFPIRTTCRIDGVIGDYYQSTCVIPAQRLTLKPGDSQKFQFSFRIQQ